MDTRLYELVNAFARATAPLHGVLAAYASWGGPPVGTRRRRLITTGDPDPTDTGRAPRDRTGELR